MTAVLKNSILALICVCFAACTGGEAVYNNSVNVHQDGWTVADSLFFAMQVEEQANPILPIATGIPYKMKLGVRYTTSYRATELPLNFAFEVADSLGRYEAIRNFRVSLPLVSDDQQPDGDSWGSLLVKEFDVTYASLCFPTMGSYRLIVQPDSTTVGIVSVSLQLNE